MNSVYSINKGVDKPIVFRGLKAQYIWWLAIGIALLLFVFAILYLVDVSLLVCILVIAVLGSGLFYQVYALNKRYGEHGWMKEMARRSVPKVVKGHRYQLIKTVK